MAVESDLASRPKRVIKAPAVRRAELIDCAQRLFLQKGYERTTINDVIAETGLSKGAFYHHFAAKEDLLEAIASRFGQDAVAAVAAVQADASLGALQRLNGLMAVGREWKAEHMPQLRAMFTVLLRSDNAVLYHRIVAAVFAVLSPTVTAIIEQGAREGAFDVADAGIAAEALLWLGEGRRTLIVRAMEVAAAGNIDEAVRLILHRVRAEESIIDRILGLPAGSVELMGSVDELRTLIIAWIQIPEAGDRALG
jgi:AcrR family transcriptional regulator